MQKQCLSGHIVIHTVSTHAFTLYLRNVLLSSYIFCCLNVTVSHDLSGLFVYSVNITTTQVKTETETADEQAGFRQGMGTREQITNLRNY